MISSCGRPLRVLVVVSLLALPSLPVLGQQEPPPPEETPPVVAEPPEPPAAEPGPTEPEAPTTPVPSGTGGEETEVIPRPAEDRVLPRLDVYFPEGELDLRVNRLINKTFFEGQVKYNFIDGDITAFLRYRYYGFKRTTQITVFDSIEFDDIDDSVTDDFDRVRGFLTLLQWPHSYTQRTFGLIEIDRISSNKRPQGSEFFFRRDQTNNFIRIGYQLGTPDEGRSSAIAGETRARTERLFSAFREFGPGDSTITAAMTYGIPHALGDFDYLKFEMEALKRFDVSTRTFLIGRLRGGTFLHVAEADPDTMPPEPDEIDFYSVPRSEAFRLDGREYLKGLDDSERGTDQLLMTWEYFFPWFLESNRRALRLNFQNWYWILYAGVGTVGFRDTIEQVAEEDHTEFGDYIPDVGIGFESSFNLRKYRFFLSGIVAQALKGDGGVEARISVKSYR